MINQMALSNVQPQSESLNDRYTNRKKRKRCVRLKEKRKKKN